MSLISGQELADDAILGWFTFNPETALAIMISKKISTPATLKLDTDTQTAMNNLEANITKLVQCGFTVDTSVSALTKTGNDLTKAVELLFKPYKKQTTSSDGAVESDGMADQTSAVDGVTTVPEHVDDVIVSGGESATDHDNDVIMSECPAQINDVTTPDKSQVDPAPAIASTPSPDATRDIAPAPRGYVYVTPKEKKQVEKLMKLGYAESECLQAFFAFDKDADAAAEFLRNN